MSMDFVTGKTRFDDTRKNCAWITIIVILLLGMSSAQSASGPVQGTPAATIGGSPRNIRSGHILVRFKAQPSQDVLNQLNTSFGARMVGTIAEIGVAHLVVPPEKQFALLRSLRQRPDVEFAEFDSIVQALQAVMTPNDPYFSTAYSTAKYGNIAQWAPQAVSAPSAWAATAGSQSIVIAIVDTGVDDTHPDLASKIVGEYSVIGGGVKDGFGHGTHVAGIAAAATDNSRGIAGICWNCGILSVKVLDSQGSGYISDVASGITYAATHGARVISLSLGGPGRTQTLDSALNYAVANNALPVCAMGNSGSAYNTPEPAYWYSCLTVIATDQSGAKASFSNYGTAADVAAPGVAVLSTMPTYPVTLNSYGYKENYDALSGTSMATPVVSGIAGLVLSMNPNLTPAQLKGIIMAAAGDGVTWTQHLAFGIVNAATAVSMAIHSDYVPPTPNLPSPVEGATVSGLVTVQAAPTDNTTVHHVDIIQNDTRLMQPLIGTSTTTCTSKKSCTTMPAWTVYWPSTALWNGSVSVSAIAADVFGNTSTAQNVDFNIQNKLVTQSGTAQVCWPSTSSCPNTVWQPVTTGVATQAATHLRGTVNYGSLTNAKYADFWLQVYSANPDGTAQEYFCGTDQTTIDCYTPLLLQPASGKTQSNYSGGQIDLIPPNSKQTASGSATINWTLSYPQ
jgi:thermitase